MKTPFPISSTLHIISIIICGNILSGCSLIPSILPNPYIYQLNKYTPKQYIGCINISHIDSVEQTADNSMRIFKGGALAFGLNEAADHITDITITPTAGKNFTIGFRSTPHDYLHNKGLEFTFDDKAILIKEHGKIIDKKQFSGLQEKKQERFIIINDAAEYSLQIGCDIVYRGKTKLQGTEYCFLHPSGETELHAQAITMTNIRMTKPSLTIEKLAEQIANSRAME